jgi:hypothetical protein
MIIKEFCKKVNTCVIRTFSYNHSLEYLMVLFAEAEGDFPGLKAKDVEVVQYGGQSYARTFGIEFHPITPPPAEYVEIDQLEYI